MATINGTLKYKQDDGSIAELNPVGVDNRARTRLNNVATQIQCIEQTTGYNASPEDVPATSMKASIETINTKVTALNTRVSNLEQTTDDRILLPIAGTVRSTMQAASGNYQVILALFPTVEYEKAIIKGVNGIVDTGIHKANTIKIVRPTGEMTNVINIVPGFNLKYPEVTIILDSLPSDIVNGAVVSISGAYLYIMFQ